MHTCTCLATIAVRHALYVCTYTSCVYACVSEQSDLLCFARMRFICMHIDRLHKQVMFGHRYTHLPKTGSTNTWIPTDAIRSSHVKTKTTVVYCMFIACLSSRLVLIYLLFCGSKQTWGSDAKTARTRLSCNTLTHTWESMRTHNDFWLLSISRTACVVSFDSLRQVHAHM